jgi:hypothetical protein
MSGSEWVGRLRLTAVGGAAGGFGAAVANGFWRQAAVYFVAWVAAVVWEWRS